MSSGLPPHPGHNDALLVSWRGQRAQGRVQGRSRNCEGGPRAEMLVPPLWPVSWARSFLAYRIHSPALRAGSQQTNANTPPWREVCFVPFPLEGGPSPVNGLFILLFP